MIILCVLLVALWLADHLTDWVTPYLAQVLRERGLVSALEEAIVIEVVVR